jgi:NADPH:quinone reductase-like Zn-dependent oxidoreductase
LPKHGAFQEYPVVYETLASPIPDNLPYEQAVVLPLSISTAAYGLYVKDCLGLPLPTTSPKPSEKTVLVWGASSSVGSSAVQLATASGINVIGVASKRNHDYVRSLGAKEVLDYHDPSVMDNAVNSLEKGQFVGIYDAICKGETLPTCVKIAEQLGGGRIACALEPYGDIPENVKVTFCESVAIVLAGFHMLMRSRSRFLAK